jgi:hypothetical protein
LFSELNSAEPSKDSPKNGGKRCMLASVAECSTVLRYSHE